MAGVLGSTRISNVLELGPDNTMKLLEFKGAKEEVAALLEVLEPGTSVLFKKASKAKIPFTGTSGVADITMKKKPLPGSVIIPPDSVILLVGELILPL
ncbi:hypothetical protein [Bacillus cereus]|uniref:hypothetical protein n=1 Tax=Bacillus cereus TaxID=1396 RepID=UPI003D64FFD6